MSTPSDVQDDYGDSSDEGALTAEELLADAQEELAKADALKLEAEELQAAADGDAPPPAEDQGSFGDDYVAPTPAEPQGFAAGDGDGRPLTTKELEQEANEAEIQAEMLEKEALADAARAEALLAEQAKADAAGQKAVDDAEEVAARAEKQRAYKGKASSREDRRRERQEAKKRAQEKKEELKNPKSKQGDSSEQPEQGGGPAKPKPKTAEERKAAREQRRKDREERRKAEREKPAASVMEQAAGALGAAGKAAADAARQVGKNAGRIARGRRPRFSGLTHQFSWNIFRYMGDFIHLFGVVIMLLTMWKNQAVTGLSMRTAIVYAVLFSCRYLDLWTHKQPMYLVFFKVTYIITSYVAILGFYKWGATFERSKDTVNIALILAGCLVVAFFTASEISLIQVLWVYSQYLEAFALVPQYVFCYRDPGNRDFGIVIFIMCIGIYRCFYACNWIYKKYNVANYSDMHSWIGGILEIAFFFDYLMHHFTGASMLKNAVLGLDQSMRNVSDKMEMKLFGSSAEERDKKARGLRQRLPRTNTEARELELTNEMDLAI